MRFLSELCWIPDAFLRDYIEWETVSDLIAKATIKIKGIFVLNLKLLILYYDNLDKNGSLNFEFKENG